MRGGCESRSTRDSRDKRRIDSQGWRLRRDVVKKQPKPWVFGNSDAVAV